MHNDDIQQDYILRMIFPMHNMMVFKSKHRLGDLRVFLNHPMICWLCNANVGEPSCYDEAISVHDHVKWKQALQNELEGIHKNGKHYHVNGCGV